MILLLAIAMGIQNASARKLAVADLMTTVKVENPAPLAVSAGLLATASFFAYRASRSTSAWAEAHGP